IEFVAHAFLQAGDDVVVSEHAFIAYKLIAAVFGARAIEVPSPDMHHQLDEMLAAITPRTRVVFIANPNNPTGTLLTQEEINRFMRALPERIIAVFDEAYFEYVDDPPDALHFVRAGRNAVVLRTFSKIHGLANLRIGYGLARQELIEVLQKTRLPFNVGGIAQAGALAALEDKAHQHETKKLADESRRFFESEFARMKLPFVAGSGNFVLVQVGNGVAIFRRLLARGIIVRALKGYALPEWVRISFGTMEQNRECISALRESLTDPPA
ncbi:MAG: histidinol-phosphate transaminase, partial [Chthoniobacterales bacterium]